MYFSSGCQWLECGDASEFYVISLLTFFFPPTQAVQKAEEEKETAESSACE